MPREDRSHDFATRTAARPGGGPDGRGSAQRPDLAGVRLATAGGGAAAEPTAAQRQGAGRVLGARRAVRLPVRHHRPRPARPRTAGAGPAARAVMNELMVDSDVLIDYQRGHARARAWFAGLTDPLTVVGFV